MNDQEINSFNGLPDGIFCDSDDMWHAYHKGEFVGAFHTVEGAAREYTYWRNQE